MHKPKKRNNEQTESAGGQVYSVDMDIDYGLWIVLVLVLAVQAYTPTHIHPGDICTMMDDAAMRDTLYLRTERH